MSAELERYALALPDADRQVLLSSIPLLIAMVVGADREFDELEMDAAVTALLQTAEQLGQAFRWSPEAQAEFDKLCRTARDEGTMYFYQRLRALHDVVEVMPPLLADEYKAFVREMCLALAEASGGFLWFGDRISDEERVALHKIALALGLSFGEIE